jgi:FkbM family methyltransferase
MSEDKFILFDIGANFGTDSIEKTQRNEYCETWAFEPTPELIRGLEIMSEKFHERYHIIPLALSDYDGISKFNITGHNNWGCSSLNDFEDSLEVTWPNRPDFYFTKTIPMMVSRFDTWYRESKLNLKQIDYFHCDAQGSDLKILKGMGDYIHLIKNGVIECAREPRVRLYKQSNSLDESKEFLLSKGFKIIKEESNDEQNNEINLYFGK